MLLLFSYKIIVFDILSWINFGMVTISQLCTFPKIAWTVFRGYLTYKHFAWIYISWIQNVFGEKKK